MPNSNRVRSTPVEAAFALPAGFTALLIVGAVAAQAHLARMAVQAGVGIVVALGCAVAEPSAAVPLAIMGWLTAAAFSQPPYGQLHPAGTLSTAIVLAVVAVSSAAIGATWRVLRAARAKYSRLVNADASPGSLLPANPVATTRRPSSEESAGSDDRTRAVRPVGRVPWRDYPRRAFAGLTPRRMVVGFAMTVAGLPALTAALVAVQPHLALDDDLLLYLAAVVAITLVGGFWPAVFAAGASSLLLNWFFTPPRHTWTIDAPQNLLALLLFVTVAVSVSSTVHLAARRAKLAARLTNESNTLLMLARSVLAGDDTVQAIVDQLGRAVGHPSELVERVGRTWVRVAGTAQSGGAVLTIRPRPDIELRVHGLDPRSAAPAVSGRVLEAFAAQAAAALDRERLRTQAAQAEALAEGNRMRTALLAAVSHDLRTPLASVKASVSSLRQTDVTLAAGDQAELLATIEEGADRLNGLINNLLDMSRIHTGALQPFVRPTALDEVVPASCAGLDGSDRLRLEVADDLPLIAADPGLLERALANLVSNALRYSPPDQPPTLAACVHEATVAIDVIDHGPGVPRDKRDAIVQPFQQLGDARPGNDGIGLGLAVAKGFVDAMGGKLIARTTPGGGLTMRVELPTSVQIPEAAAQTGTPR